MKTACILMAAGASRRFGENKLLREFRGAPLYMRAMEAIPIDMLARVVVVSGNGEILSAARERGFAAVLNEAPEEGVSRTIRMGLNAAGDCGAAIFMVADQPLLTRDSVARQLALLNENPENIVALSYDGRRGNPVAFPKEFFEELRALEGDRGGSRIASAHEDRLLLSEAKSPLELHDVDSIAEWEELEQCSNT